MTDEMTPLSPYSCSPLPVYPSWLLKCRLSVRFVPWQIPNVLCSLPEANTVLSSPFNWTRYSVRRLLSKKVERETACFFFCCSTFWNIYVFTVGHYWFLNMTWNVNYLFQAWTEKWVIIGWVEVVCSLIVSKLTLHSCIQIFEWNFEETFKVI